MLPKYCFNLIFSSACPLNVAFYCSGLAVIKQFLVYGCFCIGNNLVAYVAHYDFYAGVLYSHSDEQQNLAFLIRELAPLRYGIESREMLLCSEESVSPVFFRWQLLIAFGHCHIVELLHHIARDELPFVILHFQFLVEFLIFCFLLLKLFYLFFLLFQQSLMIVCERVIISLTVVQFLHRAFVLLLQIAYFLSLFPFVSSVDVGAEEYYDKRYSYCNK